MKLLVAAVAAVLCVTGTAATAGFAGALGCATPRVGHVAVVIDFGAAPGAPTGVLARCVTVGSGARGKEALTAAAGTVGRDASGKVCQIAGIPAVYDPANCSAPRDGRIAYWSYFKGTAAGWTYSSIGDAAPQNRVRSEVVEGWRFVEIAEGSTRSHDPPRDFVGSDGRLHQSNRWESTCPGATPPTVPPAAPSHTSVPDPVVPGGHGTQGQPSDGGSDTTRERGTTRVPTTDPVAPSTTGTGRADDEPGSSTTTGSSPGEHTADRAVPRLTRAQVAAAADAGQPGSRPTGAILFGGGVVLVVVVGSAVLTIRSRRRRAEEP